MDIRQRTTILYILLGGVLGTVLAVAVLPDWLPVLATSITEGTVYWLLARVGGFVAYGLLWLSVVFGLLLTSKEAKSWPGVRQAHSIHQGISLLALLYTLFHALILLGDRYIGFNLRMVLSPFTAMAYRPLAVGMGQLGAYLFAIVMLSFYMRKRIGVKTWRVLHYLTFILYYLVIAHGLLAGTDSRTPWALAIYVSTGLVTYILTVYRVLVAVKTNSKETHDLASFSTVNHNSVG
jgi:predicted ferric reductase